MISRLRGLMLGLALMLSGAAHAELHALLVGVSGYPTLPERMRLQGPRNDVLRMRQVLVQRGFAAEHIRLLADGVPGAPPPTRANILQALEQLADARRPGDTVFIHFAGHGSRQPAPEAEGGGLTPIFLPLDSGTWSGAGRTVGNAITSRELRERVDRIAERGAFVWGVFDACHSATLVRGTERDELRYRYVDPAELGIAREDLDRAAASALRTRGPRAEAGGALDAPARPAPAARGGTAFFYATQAGELTPELPLPAGDPKRQPYGLFSFIVSRTLERAQAMSYRQLGQAVLTEYGAIVEARATPLFSGDALDKPVLGQQGVPLRQWPLQPGGPPAVAAGRLSGVVPGSVFAVLPGPLARDGERLGHLQATAVDAARAELAPLAYAGQPAPRAEALKPGQYLRLVYSPPEFALRVAFDAADCPSDCTLRDAVRRLRAEGAPGVELQWVDAGADILIRHHRGRAVFLTATQQAGDARSRDEAPGIDVRQDSRPVSAGELAERLGRGLHAIARARNLLTLAARFAADPGAGGMVATLRRSGNGAAGELLTPERVPELRSGDMLTIEVANRGTRALDLTVLYADADHGIVNLFPSSQGESNRIEPGTQRRVEGIRINAPPVGIERLLLIAAQAEAGAERSDFSFLQQPSLLRKRGNADDDFHAFADAAFADHRSRGATRPAAPSARTTMQVFTFHVQR